MIAVDPPGLAAMLELTGPVPMPNWPEPISSEPTWSTSPSARPTRGSHQEQRVEFLGDVAKQVAEAFTRADLGPARLVTAALGPAASDGHLLVWMPEPAEQAPDGPRSVSTARSPRSGATRSSW